MDKFLPQRLQDEAAAAIASKQAAATNVSHESRENASHAPPPPPPVTSTASTSLDAPIGMFRALLQPEASAKKPVPNPSNQSYITPMPNDATQGTQPSKDTSQDKQLNGHGIDIKGNGVHGTKAADGKPAQNGEAANADAEDRDYVDDL